MAHQPSPSPSILVGVEPWERGLRGWLRRWLRVPDVGPLVEFSIAKLSLKAGDMLVIKADGPISAQTADRLKKQATLLAPSGTKIAVLERGMHFEVIEAEPRAGVHRS